nr:PREDICTED: selenoprotein M-like [Megachile rotundata]
MAPMIAVIFFLAVAFHSSYVDTSSSPYAFARIEACSGCRLKRLPDVRQFIFEDVPNYNNVEFKHIPGAVPELLLFNENEEEVERLPLLKLTREECNDLLVSKGFTKKVTKDEI